jgi:spermidine/putrescine-binding protein
LEEIREILGKGIDDLTKVNPTNFHRTTDQVFNNIHSAFSEHQKRIDLLKQKKWAFAGSDIGSWLVMGSLAVTAPFKRAC